MKTKSLAWLLAGILEAPFTGLLFVPQLHLMEDHLWLSLLAHGLACGILYPISPRKTWLLLFPFFGWCFALLPLLASETSGSAFSVEEDLVIPQGKPIQSEPSTPNTDRKERVLRELDLLSLADILRGTDADLKRGAIERLAQLKTPEAIELLLEQRTNPSMEIRFYATSALARIKKEFDEELESAKQEMKKDIYKISARFLLAKRYFSYARSHLLDAGTRTSYSREALHHLQFVMQSPYGSEEAAWMLVEIHTDHEEWKEAFDILDQLEANKITDRSRLEQTKALLYYSMGQFDRLVRQFASMKTLGILDKDWIALANWWGIS